MSFAIMLVLACLVMLAVTAYAACAIADTTRRRNVRSAMQVAASPARKPAADPDSAMEAGASPARKPAAGPNSAATG